ncbi:MAG: hypothetical protein H6Q07_2871, partial [Acidobacteria bacterium]|nr:hypothetical protein [Acidobacteriota bacterium]
NARLDTLEELKKPVEKGITEA